MGASGDEADGVCGEYLGPISRAGGERDLAIAFAAALAEGKFGAWDECVLELSDGSSAMSFGGRLSQSAIGLSKQCLEQLREMKQAILMPHDIGSLPCSMKPPSSRITEESTPCSMSTETQPDSRAQAPLGRSRAASDRGRGPATRHSLGVRMSWEPASIRPAPRRFHDFGRCSSSRGMISTKLQGRWRLSSCHFRIPFQPSLQAPGDPGRQKM